VQSRTVDDAIKQMTSIDKLVVCLMFANRVCFQGKQPKNYKPEQTIRKMCPPKVRDLFNLDNLRRLGVVFILPKKHRLVALPSFGIDVAKKLYETGEAKRVYELYGADYV